MNAIRINSKDKRLENIEVDPTQLETQIDKSCKLCKAFWRIYLTDKNNRQKKYVLYADENSNRTPFNTKKLHFFAFGNELFQGNGLIVEDNSATGEGIIEAPINSTQQGGEIESFANSSVRWPSFESVASYIANGFDPLSETIYLEIKNQRYPLLKQIEKIESLGEEQQLGASLKGEIVKLREDIEKYYSGNTTLISSFRKLAENYNFYKNRRPVS